MNQTQSSDRTESLESTITSLYKARFHPTAKINANNKLFYRKYPHVITFGPKLPEMRWDSEAAHKRRDQLYELERHLRRHAFNYSKFRNEWINLRVYTMNPAKLLGGLPNEFMGLIVEVSLMRDEIHEHLRTKPENTFRTVNTVVKKLPFGKYRYRTHYATDGRDKRKIGKDALETIAANLSIYPGIRWNDRLTDRITMIRSTWDTTYFYSEDVDWLTMVNLVDSRFIKKIEYFTVEKELDKKSN